MKLYFKICLTASLIMAVTVCSYRAMFDKNEEEIPVAATFEENEEKIPEA